MTLPTSTCACTGPELPSRGILISSAAINPSAPKVPGEISTQLERLANSLHDLEEALKCLETDIQPILSRTVNDKPQVQELPHGLESSLAESMSLTADHTERLYQFVSSMIRRVRL